MKAMTVRQPWAQCIAIGRKTVENRVRPPGYRGEIAIHAAKAIDREGCRSRLVTALYGDDPAVGMPLGAIIAVAQLVDVHRAADCCGEWAWQGDIHHLVLADVDMLNRPVPARGSLAIAWTVPADVEAAVRAQLADEVAEVRGLVR